MVFKIKIGAKITLLVLAVIMMSVTSISLLSFWLSKNWIEKHYFDSFKMMGSIKATQIDSFFINISKLLDQAAHNDDLANSLQIATDLGLNNDTVNVEQMLQASLDPLIMPMKNRYEFKNLFITDYFSKVVYKTSGNTESFAYGQPSQRFDNIIDNKATGHVFGKPVSLPDSSVHIYASTAIRKNNNLIGHIVVEYSLEPIYDIIEDPTGLGALGTSVEISLGFYKNQGTIVYLSRQKKGDYYSPPLSKDFVVDAPHSKALQLAAKGEKSEDFMKDNIDYNGDETLAYWKSLPFMNWGMVIEIDRSEINAGINKSVIYFVALGAFVFLVAWGVVFAFSKFLTRPLITLKKELQIIAKGGLPLSVEKKSNDEIGEMAIAVDELVKALRRTAHFAKLIGEGRYDANYKPISDNDALGNALISMRNSIQTADKKDNERNWIVSGVAEIGQILRLHNNITDLSSEVIAYVTNKIEAIQGAMYVTSDGAAEKEELIEVKMEASYAYNKRKFLKGTFKFAEGLVGQAIAEKDTIMRVEIPDDYVTLTSGLLGDKKPKCILIVPLIANEVVYGVLEFAGFEKFKPTQVHFIEEISVIIARTIFNIRVNERTYRLLQESQQMSQELKLQQGVLKQNAEEMKATQEELQRTNSRLEEQILEVNRTQQRMQHLLENASEIITIYERDMTVRYISPSIEPILGYTPEEMIGKTDIDNVSNDSTYIFEGMFKGLLENPDERITVQIEYKKKNGALVLLEASGTNLMSDPSIKGIVVNTRDITERIRAEREVKRRSQMQSLSENSPDLIVRINEAGTVFYINPSIKQLTGINASDMLNKVADDIGLDLEITENWKGIIREVVEKDSKLTVEMNFPSLQGARVMQVNAIPEFNDKREVETILLVSHDITERKMAEMEIQYKNKKITESINYAKRIQTAMLPDINVLRSAFPDSMMMYKPKDVVSGDFPWMTTLGDDSYVAVGDCTGHGVPGALMSLIGYFILNDAVKTYKVSDTGLVLDLLHEGVTRTLKQDDENSTTRDGMDIALCKFNSVTRELQFSSAHRPLLYLTDGVFDQIKGEKFPIGGGANKLHKNFTTNKISVKPGDEIYLMSDGLPDQFGGEGNRKFSLRRVQEVITENPHSNMEEMSEIFEKNFFEWKGDNNQTDDILMVGIKF